MIPGEVKVEGLGKRYWFRSLGEGLANAESVDAEADADSDDEDESPLSFFRRPMAEV